MKTYKITYNSVKVKGNKFAVEAENKKEAKVNFEKEYRAMGGNWGNVLNIALVEELPKTECLNEFFKS